MSMISERQPYVPQATRSVRQPVPRQAPRTPARPTPGPGRRASGESVATRQRPIVTPASPAGRTPPPLPLRGGTSSPSVMSGREGSTFTRRGETVQSPPPAELELFAYHCRVFYFHPAPPEDSANFISRTLAALPPAHRAAYTRVQSTLRAQAHLHHLRVRISSFHALMSATTENSGLSLPARSELTARRARAERADRLGLFIRTWGGSAGALEPFFRGLWSVLRVQSRGAANRGGAGVKCVVWEVDDAVFLESGGPEFMHEAVTIIKGVLGFTDQPLSAPPRLRRVSTVPGVPAIAESDNRTRSGSDPFTDNAPLPRKSGRGPAPPPPPSRRRASPQPPAGSERRWTPEDNGATSPLLSSISPNPPSTPRLGSGPTLQQPTSPISLATTDEDDEAEEEADLNQARFRLWTFPTHITDEEAEQLMSLFPRYVSKTDQLFPLRRPRAKDLELGLPSDPWMAVEVEGTRVTIPRVECEAEASVLRSGTGRMWVGTQERAAGWAGAGWYRFKRWWRRLFGRG